MIIGRVIKNQATHETVLLPNNDADITCEGQTLISRHKSCASCHCSALFQVHLEVCFPVEVHEELLVLEATVNVLMSKGGERTLLCVCVCGGGGGGTCYYVCKL